MDEKSKPDKSKDAKAKPEQRNEGEGNRTAARRFDEAQHRFAETGKVAEKAREAEQARRGPERGELDRAEEIGKRHAVKPR